MKIIGRTSRIAVVMVMAAGLAGAVNLRAQQYVRDSEPKLFSYVELVQLGLDQEMSPELTEKLRVITTTPFINNEAYFGGAKPQPLQVTTLGPSLRIAFWNIERGQVRRWEGHRLSRPSRAHRQR